MERRKLHNFLYVLLPVIVIILTALPDCAQIHFLMEDGLEEVVEFCSGFSTLVLSNGSAAPMMTGVLCIIIAVMSIKYLVRGNKRTCYSVAVLSVVALVTSLLPMLAGAMTDVGWKISVVLDVEVAVACEMVLLIV